MSAERTGVISTPVLLSGMGVGSKIVPGTPTRSEGRHLKYAYDFTDIRYLN